MDEPSLQSLLDEMSRECGFFPSIDPAPEPNMFLAALAVAFAAFCVWLTVRVINCRERWAKWTLAVSILAGLYVAVVFHEKSKPVVSFTVGLLK